MEFFYCGVTIFEFVLEIVDVVGEVVDLVLKLGYFRIEFRLCVFEFVDTILEFLYCILLDDLPWIWRMSEGESGLFDIVRDMSEYGGCDLVGGIYFEELHMGVYYLQSSLQASRINSDTSSPTIRYPHSLSYMYS